MAQVANGEATPEEPPERHGIIVRGLRIQALVAKGEAVADARNALGLLEICSRCWRCWRCWRTRSPPCPCALRRRRASVAMMNTTCQRWQAADPQHQTPNQGTLTPDPIRQPQPNTGTPGEPSGLERRRPSEAEVEAVVHE